MMGITESERRWEYADSISDQIVDLVNKEIKDPDFRPTHFLVGLLLGLMAFLKTTKGLNRPKELVAVEVAADLCVASILGRDFRECFETTPQEHTK